MRERGSGRKGTIRNTQRRAKENMTGTEIFMQKKYAPSHTPSERKRKKQISKKDRTQKVVSFFLVPL